MATGLGDEQLWLCPTLDNATPFNDLSSQGNNGTAVGGLTTVADTGSGGAYAYDFDGSNDYIDAPTSAVEGLSTGAVSMWFKADSSASGTTSRILMSAGSGAAAQDLTSFSIGPSTSNFTDESSEFVVLDSSQNVVVAGYYRNGESFFFDDSWHHYVCMSDSTGNSVYIDGVLVSLSYTDGSSALSQGLFGTGLIRFYIGARDFNGLGRYFSGHQDDIRVYDRVLTQSEITHLATARGIEGRPFDGLGDEQLWLCPSLENSPNDISGNNNNGVYQGGMGTIADTAEGGSLAYDFDGVGDYIDCGNAIAPTTGYSASAWVNVTSFPSGSNYGTIIAKGYDGANTPFFLSFSKPTEMTSFTFDGAIHGISNYVHGMSTGAWYHVATTFDGATWKLFVNGVEVASVSDSTALTQNNLNTYVGAAFITPSISRYLSAKLDDVRLFYRALTPAEISWLATERGVLGTPPEGLGDEQLWLCPSIQDGANDLSGNGNDGVIGSSITTVADTSNGGTLAYNFPDTAGTNTITINDFDLGGLSQLTWSAWIYDESDNAASTHSSFFSWRKGGSGNDDILFFNYERSWLGFQVNNGADGQAAYTPVYYQNWKHYCVVFDGTNPTATDRLNLYVNGVLQTPGTTFSYPATTSNQTGTPYAEIGDYVGNGNHGLFNFKGKQDDIRIYDRAITPAEITHLASQRGVLGAPALPTGLGGEQLWLCPSIDDSPDDLSGNGNNGTYVGGMGTIADTAEGGSLAYDFDGVGDYIDCGNILDAPTDFSISLWLEVSSSQADTGVAGRWTNSPTFSGYMMWVSTANKISVPIAAAGHLEAATTVPTSSWVHAVVMYDSSVGQSRIYVDGVLSSNQLETGPTTSSVNWIVGKYNNGVDQYFQGKLDDIRTYDRPLTQAEITHLASQRGVLGSPTTTTQYNAFLTHAFRQLFQTRLR